MYLLKFKTIDLIPLKDFRVARWNVFQSEMNTSHVCCVEGNDEVYWIPFIFELILSQLFGSTLFVNCVGDFNGF